MDGVGTIFDSPRRSRLRILTDCLAMVFETAISMLISGERDSVFVASIERYVAKAIGATRTTDVRLSRKSFFHIRDTHSHIKLEHFKMLPDAIRRGFVILESSRPWFATICYIHRESSIRYAIPIKATKQGDEIYIQSFHRMKPRQTKALLNRGQALRNHK